MSVYDYVIKTRLGLEPPNMKYLESLLYTKMELTGTCEAPNNGKISMEGAPRPRRNRYETDVDLVSDLQFSPPQGGLFLASTIGNHLSLYDPLRCTPFQQLSNELGGESSALTRLTFTSSADKLAVADVRGHVALFDCRKLSEPLNSLRLHTQSVRTLLYDSTNNWLITADCTGHVQWNLLPALEIRGAQLQKGLHFGTILTSPSINQVALSSTHKLAICSKNNGSLYIIDKLDLKHVGHDLKNVRLDDSLRLHLGLSPELNSFGKRNCIRIIDPEEFTPELGSTVSKFSQAQFIYQSCIDTLLLKFTTKRKLLFGMETKDWITCVKVKESNRSLSLSPYGSDILEESLMFANEEPRFYTLTEKKAGISPCNRVIASPHIKNIRLLSFTSNLQSLDATVEWKKTNNVVSHNGMELLWPQEFKEMYTVKLMSVDKGYPLCCEFSPVSSSLIAVGDSEGRVMFYQPKL